VAGAIAMPFLIGPGSVSAATMAGMRLSVGAALLSVACALAGVLALLSIFKVCFDYVSSRNAALAERYVEVASRVSAMMVGSIAVEMMFDGLESWFSDLRG
jgi:multiple antibiotic resistance protein